MGSGMAIPDYMLDGERLITYQLECDLAINDHQASGAIVGSYDLDRNLFRGLVDVEDVPELDNATLLASKYSVACWSCCIASRERLGALNLMYLFDDSFSCDAGYTIFSPDLSALGDLRQTCRASIDRADDSQCARVTGSVGLTGSYDGPVNASPEKILAHAPGYAMTLRQVDIGEVEGVLAYPNLHADAPDGRSTGYTFSKRMYRYDTNRVLPSEVVQHYKLLDLSVEIAGGRRLSSFAATAYYSPLSAAGLD